MRTGIFGKFAIVFSMSFGFSSFTLASEIEESDAKCTSGFQCIGAYNSQAACDGAAADACATLAAAACAAHNAHVASLSCESCGYSDATMSQEHQPLSVFTDTCPQPGSPAGWYSRMWYTCDN